MDARIRALGDGAIVFDAALGVQPEHGWFDPEHWRAQGLLDTETAAGRGTVAFVRTPAGACALRHYHRGGMVAPLLGDRYLWSGRERTRGFAEFRLLARLRELGLPAPAPVAARYLRVGLHYTAELLTQRIEPARTLAQWLHDGKLDAALAARVGALIARFHAAGVDHADLNAHNVLDGPNGLWLVDFDRGKIRAQGADWRLANLARLKRSLLKLGAAAGDEPAFERGIWAALMRGYEEGLR